MSPRALPSTASDFLRSSSLPIGMGDVMLCSGCEQIRYRSPRKYKEYKKV